MRVFITVFFVSLASSVFSQQNLFNIPSGDITPVGKFFYQHQLNVYTSKMESKAHFVYGLGKDWDIGFNLVGKGFYFTPEWRSLYNSDQSKGALYPILMGTVQKSFIVNKHWKVNIGAQGGANLSNSVRRKEFNYFTYGLLSWSPGDNHRLKLVAGPYYTTNVFVGTGNRAGVLAGYEWLLGRGWYLMGDFISGNNDSSVSVFGFMKTISKRVQLCAGYMLPNPRTPKPEAIVLEINILGWDYGH